MRVKKSKQYHNNQTFIDFKQFMFDQHELIGYHISQFLVEVIQFKKMAFDQNTNSEILDTKRSDSLKTPIAEAESTTTIAISEVESSPNSEFEKFLKTTFRLFDDYYDPNARTRPEGESNFTFLREEERLSYIYATNIVSQQKPKRSNTLIFAFLIFGSSLLMICLMILLSKVLRNE